MTRADRLWRNQFESPRLPGEHGGEDVATGLLDRALAWARENGYVRCAVDHESANLEATRFWSRHFTPAAFSYVRRVSPAVSG